MVDNIHLRLSIMQFLQYFIWGSWFVTAGTYLLENLSFNGREVGLVYGSTAIAATISPFLLGILADRFFSAEKMLAILHFVGGGVLFGLSFVQNFIWFYPLMLLYVLCYMPTFSLSNSLCFHHIADAKRDFPRVRVWGTVSWILAGLLVGYLQIEDQPLPFRIAAACSIVQGFYCLTLPHTPPLRKAGSKVLQSIFGPEIRQLLRDRSFSVIILSIGFIAIPASFYYSFVNPFLNEVGVVNAAGKMALGQVTEIVLMLSLPWFFRILKLKTILFMGLFIWGARYALLIVGLELGNEIWYLLALALHGAAFIFSQLTAQIYLDTKVPAHLRSTAQGFYSLLTLGLGVFVGSWIAGETVTFYTLVDGSHQWKNIWLVPTFFGIVVSLIFYFTYQTKKAS